MGHGPQGKIHICSQLGGGRATSAWFFLVNDRGEIFYIRKMKPCGISTLPGPILPWDSLQQRDEGSQKAFCGFEEWLCIPVSLMELYTYLGEVDIGYISYRVLYKYM